MRRILKTKIKDKMKCLISLIVILLASLTSTQNNSYPNLGFVFAKGKNRIKVLLSNLDAINASTLPFNSTLKTVVWFFGFNQDVTSGYDLQSEFERLGGYNFITVDWSSYNNGSISNIVSFADAIKNINPIAKLLAAAIEGLVSSGSLDVGNLHFIGLSLGAHLSGNTARESATLSVNATVPRLTGLDPAGQLIYPPNTKLVGDFQGLKKTDGECFLTFQIVIIKNVNY